MFHRHIWVEAERFLSPAITLDHMKGSGVAVLEMLNSCRALTTILYRCECGDFVTQKITGTS